MLRAACRRPMGNNGQPPKAERAKEGAEDVLCMQVQVHIAERADVRWYSERPAELFWV